MNWTCRGRWFISGSKDQLYFKRRSCLLIMDHGKAAGESPHTVVKWHYYIWEFRHFVNILNLVWIFHSVPWFCNNGIYVVRKNEGEATYDPSAFMKSIYPIFMRLNYYPGDWVDIWKLWHLGTHQRVTL